MVMQNQTKPKQYLKMCHDSSGESVGTSGSCPQWLAIALGEFLLLDWFR